MSALPSPQENAHARTKALRLQAENARLKAEVERLTEAGDSIIMITSQYVTDSTLRNLALREWQAAKEGKPSV